jgi:hypothetical protein
MLLTTVRGLLPASKFSGRVDFKWSILKGIACEQWGRRCGLKYIHVPTYLPETPAFQRKYFLGLSRTAVEKIVIAERRKLLSSGLLTASGGNPLPTFRETYRHNLQGCWIFRHFGTNQLSHLQVSRIYRRFGTTYRPHIQGSIIYRRFGTSYSPHL